MPQLPESSASLKQDNNVKYQGRKASRTGSEQRRRLILEAALRIVVREGVRGIRHRAIAKEAGVPLAATTYYFKDIEELINDTFTLYAEQALEVVNQFSMQLYQPANGKNEKSFVELLASADVMTEAVADKMTEYVVEQITEHRDSLVAEQAFRYEALLSPRLRVLGKVHKEALIQKLTELLSLIQSPNPSADANIMISILNRLEYEGLLVEPDDINRDEIRDTLLRQLTLVFNSCS